MIIVLIGYGYGYSILGEWICHGARTVLLASLRCSKELVTTSPPSSPLVIAVLGGTYRFPPEPKTVYVIEYCHCQHGCDPWATMRRTLGPSPP